MFEHVHAGLLARMTTADEHSDTSRLLNHPPSKIGETAIVIHASAACPIIAIVGDKHPADAKIIIGLDQTSLSIQRLHTLDVEVNRKFTVPFSTEYVFNRDNENVVTRSLENPPAHKGQHFKAIMPFDKVIEVDIHRGDIHSCITKPLELRKKRVVRAKRHTGVVVPDKRLMMKRRSFRANIPGDLFHSIRVS